MKWTLSLILALCLGSQAWGAEPGTDNNNLKVKVGPFFIQESEKMIKLEGTGPHVVRKGKRINITVTIENYGKEKSEPVKLKYMESGGKAGEPRVYGVPAIEPGQKWERTFMVRYDVSGKKSVTAALSTLENKPMMDAKGTPRPRTSDTGIVNLAVTDM